MCGCLCLKNFRCALIVDCCDAISQSWTTIALIRRRETAFCLRSGQLIESADAWAEWSRVKTNASEGEREEESLAFRGDKVLAP